MCSLHFGYNWRWRKCKKKTKQMSSPSCFSLPTSLSCLFPGLYLAVFLSVVWWGTCCKANLQYRPWPTARKLMWAVSQQPDERISSVSVGTEQKIANAYTKTFFRTQRAKLREKQKICKEGAEGCRWCESEWCWARLRFSQLTCQMLGRDLRSCLVMYAACSHLSPTCNTNHSLLLDISIY